MSWYDLGGVGCVNKERLVLDGVHEKENLRGTKYTFPYWAPKPHRKQHRNGAQELQKVATCCVGLI